MGKGRVKKSVLSKAFPSLFPRPLSGTGGDYKCQGETERGIPCILYALDQSIRVLEG